MKKRIFLIFGIYIWTKTLLGLTFYPLKQTRQIIKRPVLFPVIFSPFLTLFTLFLLGRIAAFFVQTTGIFRQTIAVILGGAFVSILAWQLLVIYLFFIFWISRSDV